MKYPAKADYPDNKKGWDTACKDYNYARRKFHYTGTKAARADKVQSMRDALARAEAAEAAVDE